MDKDREMLVRIRDAIGACRLDPSIGHEFTVVFTAEQGGGAFKIRIENANANKGPAGS